MEIPVDRRTFLAASSSFLAELSSPYKVLASQMKKNSPWIHPGGVIKVGYLWSLTGGLSTIEKPSRDVGLFWADEVNRNGGIAGCKIEPVVFDAESDMKTYRTGIKKLMHEDKVLAVFGGFTSASRRSVMPLVTLANHLFYYPTVYEGKECWQNLICTGALANQHSYDLIPYMVKKFGPRGYFIGSNYVWPKESNRNAHQWLENAKGEKVGEEYVPLGLGNFEPILEDVKKKKADWIFLTVVGTSELFFRKAYIKAGLTPDKLPTAALTTSEMEVKAMGYEYGEGHYTSAPYFQSINSPTNKKFVEGFLSSPYGETGVTHANMESTYLSFQFFKKAVEKLVLESGEASITPKNVRDFSANLKLSPEESPQGDIRIDPNNFHCWLTPKIGRFDSRGQVEIMHERKELVKPEPLILYPHRGTCHPDGLHLPSGKIVKAAS